MLFVLSNREDLLTSALPGSPVFLPLVLCPCAERMLRTEPWFVVSSEGKEFDFSCQIKVNQDILFCNTPLSSGVHRFLCVSRVDFLIEIGQTELLLPWALFTEVIMQWKLKAELWFIVYSK